MKRMYISGAISGVADYKARFEQVERKMKLYDIPCYNPAKECKAKGDWKDFMKYDIVQLLSCDCIYMMKGWRTSKGARLEHYIAKKLGYFVVYERG